jgi:hypothetical protein
VYKVYRILDQGAILPDYIRVRISGLSGKNLFRLRHSGNFTNAEKQRFSIAPFLSSCGMMVRKKRIAITTSVGLLTGLYCAGSLLISAPAGITPEPWFMAMILYGRTLQGFTIGFADGIPLHWAVRGGGLGALFSLMLALVPFNARNYFGAAMLIIFGIIYGILADGIASRVVQENIRGEG